MYDMNYKLLANAIILQAVDDYYKDVRCRPSIEQWIKSEEYYLLSRNCLDADLLIKFLRQEAKQNGKKKAITKNRITDFF